MADQPTPKDPIVSNLEKELERAKTSPFAASETRFYENALNSYLEKKSRKATPGNTNELAGAAGRTQDMNEQIERVERSRPDKAAKLRNRASTILREDDRQALISRIAARQRVELPDNPYDPRMAELLNKVEEDTIAAMLGEREEEDSPLYYTPARPGVEREVPGSGPGTKKSPESIPANFILAKLYSMLDRKSVVYGKRPRAHHLRGKSYRISFRT